MSLPSCQFRPPFQSTNVLPSLVPHGLVRAALHGLPSYSGRYSAHEVNPAGKGPQMQPAAKALTAASSRRSRTWWHQPCWLRGRNSILSLSPRNGDVSRGDELHYPYVRGKLAQPKKRHLFQCFHTLCKGVWAINFGLCATPKMSYFNGCLMLSVPNFREAGSQLFSGLLKIFAQLLDIY